MTELRRGWEKKAVDREKAWTRDLFGSASTAGSDAISSRDAAGVHPSSSVRSTHSRCCGGQATPATLCSPEPWHSTRSSNSATHSAATFGEVVSANAETSPSVGSKVEVLIGLQQEESLQGGFLAAIHLSVSKPSELSR